QAPGQRDAVPPGIGPRPAPHAVHGDVVVAALEALEVAKVEPPTFPDQSVHVEAGPSRDVGLEMEHRPGLGHPLDAPVRRRRSRPCTSLGHDVRPISTTPRRTRVRNVSTATLGSSTLRPARRSKCCLYIGEATTTVSPTEPTMPRASTLASLNGSRLATASTSFSGITRNSAICLPSTSAATPRCGTRSSSSQ